MINISECLRRLNAPRRTITVRGTVLKIRIIVLGALWCFASSAFAAPPEARGFYVGGMGGATELEDDGLFSGLAFDDSDAGFALFGGYKILKYLAVEARLSSLGSYSVAGPFGSDDLETTAISAHAIGIIPFGASGWELFGQLGLGVVNIETDAFGDESETIGSAGVGVRFFPNSHLGISLQTDAYAYEEDGSFGDSYDVGIVTTQIGLQYLF